MAFVEKQRHGKHDYYYLVKTVRLSPTKFKKIRVSLGRNVPKHGELQGKFAELERKVPKPYSPKWLSKEAAERLEDLKESALAFKNLPEGENDFLVRYTYNTNAIEGNPLTLRETALILSEGIFPQGSKTDSVFEVLNGKDAWDFITAYKGTLGKMFAKKIQYEVTKNTACRIQGGYRDSQVGITGSNWKPPAAPEVPRLMDGMFAEYKKKKRALHPVELAAWLHNRTAQIHPFTDGNGRTARLLMNWVLMKNKFPPAIIENRNKQEYYAAIEKADAGNEKPFVEFLARELLQQYTKTQETQPE
jgi:Fic family protein